MLDPDVVFVRCRSRVPVVVIVVVVVCLKDGEREGERKHTPLKLNFANLSTSIVSLIKTS